MAEESRRRALSVVEGLFEDAAGTGGEPRERIRVFSEQLANLESCEEIRVRIELWAGALHDPTIREILRRATEDVTEAIERSLRALRGKGDTDTESVSEARAMTSSWNGSALWRSLLDDPQGMKDL